MMWIIGVMNWHMGRLRRGQKWSNDGSEGACQPHIDDHATENDDEANNNTIRDGGSTVLQTADTVDSVGTVDTVDTVNMAYTVDRVYTVDMWTWRLMGTEGTEVDEMDKGDKAGKGAE